MSVRMWSPILARVITVLQDRMTAELTAIDTEESDGITTPTIPNANYHEYRRRVVTAFPAVRLEPLTADITTARPTGFGERVDANYNLNVHVDVTLDIADDDALRLQKYVIRYVTAIFRILVLKYDALDTIADPVRFAKSTIPVGALVVGPLAENEEEGIITRSGTVSVSVRRIEAI